MRCLLFGIFIVISPLCKSQDDSLMAGDSFVLPDSTLKFKRAHSISLFTEPKQRLLGAQYLMHFRYFKAGLFYQHSWNKRWMYDTISSGLPYLVTDTALYYEINSYENKKSAYGLSFETNFRPGRNKGKMVLGLSLYTGQYSFKQLNADTYFKYYTDSLGNVYYHDVYDDPNSDPLQAWRFTLRYSHTEMKYRYFGADPYIGYTGTVKNNLSLGVFFKAKYNRFKWIEGYFYDPSQVLPEPREKFSSLKFSLMASLFIYLHSQG